MSTTFRDYCQMVKDQAFGQWPELLQTLAGLSDQQVDLKTKVTGTDCYLCGGNDRYSFKDADKGGWACRNCGGGDGWTMLERANGWSFTEAVRQVADCLGIESFSGNRAVSPEQKAIQQEKARQRREATQARQIKEVEQLRQQHDQRANYALQEWGSGIPATPNHAYLTVHGLPPFNLKQIQHPVYGDCLLVPLFNEQGKLRNLERINPEGIKRPIKGAQKKGCFYQFGSQTWTVSTQKPVHEAKLQFVV